MRSLRPAVRLCRGAAVLVLGAAFGVLTATPAQAQDDTAGRQLAETYAPVVRVQAQPQPCGPGEAYDPVPVDVVLDDAEVAFRGPWDRVNLVTVGPSAEDLAAGLPGYHLDFPGDPLDAGCAYEEWERRSRADTNPTTYARTVLQPGDTDRLSLQYWFFYVFNDYNNTHEGDWEMIQLEFATGDVGQALAEGPTEVGYSQHEGGERAQWGADKLEVVDGTHPVVYPAAGSHANYFAPAVFLGRTGDQGVGCDDTTGPHRELRLDTAFVPAEPSDYLAEFPWLGYEGHWGELQDAFFNGPTGPNTKEQWEQPITWAEESWRDDAFAVPLGQQVLGERSATEFFCGSVAAGSDLLRRALANPVPVFAALGALVILVLVVASRTRWSPAESFPLKQRRRWGQSVVAAWSTYRHRPLLYAGIGSIYVAVMLVAAGVQWLLFSATALKDFRDVAGDTHGYVIAVVLLIGAFFSLIAYVAVLAATAWSLAELDAGRAVTVRSAVMAVRRQGAALAGAGALLLAAVAALNLALVTVPVAVYILVRRGFFAQAVVLDGLGARAALGRSKELVHRNWWRMALVSTLVVGLGALLGPVVGVGMLFLTQASFGIVNLVSGLVYAVTIPFVGLVLAYLYADLLSRRAEAESRTTGSVAADAAVR